ncbi:hypothetical protein CRE_28811 [Caenorhabditis remanei]|uniref:Uncharacterized protein n=1 Tax=Caenorhabditis remanei TaxID=31234 RepID=E3MK82_CAERE|nr:hypothetical protein CRE_28811 [Caenorhabditis remanei]
MAEKEVKMKIDPFDNNNEEVKSGKWSWREIHLQFILFTSPLPLFFIITGALKYYDCDFLLAIWMIVMGVLMELELVYISVYFQRLSVESKTESDLDDAIFGQYVGQRLKDPMLQKSLKLHFKIGFLSYFGIAKCYYIVLWSNYCSGFVFWPTLLISLFYGISLVVLVCFSVCKSKPGKHQNMIV